MKFTGRSIRALCISSFIVACSGAPPTEEPDSNDISSSTDALSPGALSRVQTKTTLKLIDDICGDSWCEGDDDFAFDTLVCIRATGRCTLVFKIIPRDEVPGARSFYWRSCTTRGFTGFDSLVSTAPNGYQSLNPDYYDALGECISRVEDRLHDRLSASVELGPATDG